MGRARPFGPLRTRSVGIHAPEILVIPGLGRSPRDRNPRTQAQTSLGIAGVDGLQCWSRGPSRNDDMRMRAPLTPARSAMTPDDRDVLLIVDVQNDFCPGGALAAPDGDAIVPAVNRLARSFAHVILTQDWHPPGHASFASSHPGRSPFEAIEVSYGTQILWPDHCVQGTEGASFHPELDVPHAELVVRKGFRRAID